MAELRGLGRIEMLGSMSFDKGMKMFSDISISDPKKYVAVYEAMLRAMKGGAFDVYKDVKTDRDIKTYRGMKFTRTVLTIDLDKLSQMGGNDPAQVERMKSTMKSMYNGDTVTYWLGANGHRVLQVLEPTWDLVKAQVDGYLDNRGGVGETAGFKAVRAALPEQGSLFVIIETQSIAKSYAGLFATMLKQPNQKLGEDTPKEPAFLGVSLTLRPPLGFEFHLVIPSEVGTVVAKGLVPMFRGLARAAAGQSMTGSLQGAKPAVGSAQGALAGASRAPPCSVSTSRSSNRICGSSWDQSLELPGPEPGPGRAVCGNK